MSCLGLAVERHMAINSTVEKMHDSCMPGRKNVTSHILSTRFLRQTNNTMCFTTKKVELGMSKNIWLDSYSDVYRTVQEKCKWDRRGSVSHLQKDCHSAARITEKKA